MNTESEVLRLEDKAQWILTRRPDVKIERSTQPTVLSCSEAVTWIKNVRPMLWLGSIFSVPEPSGFPSGFALTQSLLELALTGTDLVDKDRLVLHLAATWPLEALIDAFEFVGADLSASMLAFFKGRNNTTEPSLLHKAAVSYYQSGLSKLPLCVTTNWDTLLEKAFRQSGTKAVIAGPTKIPDAEFKRPRTSENKVICVYHPHGSFENRDVVCSFAQEQRQFTLDPTFLGQPTLFLGYSGYEPSLYMNLEHSAGQLWCVRNRDELKNPAKRRLLCRPNTFVFIGDLRELLASLDLLSENVDLASAHLAAHDFDVPKDKLEVVQAGMLGSLDPALCVSELAYSIISQPNTLDRSARFIVLMRALVNHVIDRTREPSLLAGLLAAAQFYNSESSWITVLGFLLRHRADLPTDTIDRLIALADSAPRPKEQVDWFEDIAVYGFGSVRKRPAIYRSHVGKASQIDDWRIYFVSGLYSHDFAALGEFMELLAFKHLRDGVLESASACFDYAASCLYLRGLNRAGRLNEWAANNVAHMKQFAHQSTLMIPMPPQT